VTNNNTPNNTHRAPTDIVVVILETLIERLKDDLQTPYRLEDPLRARLVTEAPLQDDPTRKACYVEVKPDPEKTRELDKDHPMEIGGGTRWINRFVVHGWTKMQTSKPNGYSHTGEFVRRVLQALLTHFDLDGATAEDGEYVTGCNLQLVDSHWFKVFGGDREWYGEYEFRIHFYSERFPGTPAFG
jgi:hypothetical protein